jgi:uncharacterized protein (TIGR02246 family)
MKLRIPALAAWFLLVAVAQPSLAQATDFETEVLGAWADLDRHWNARDPDAFTALFSREASFVFVDRRESLEGRDEILERFSVQFSAMAPDLRHRTSLLELRSIAHGVIAVDGTVQVLRSAAEEGQESEVVLDFAIFGVMARGDEGWEIRVLRVVELPDETEG